MIYKETAHLASLPGPLTKKVPPWYLILLVFLTATGVWMGGGYSSFLTHLFYFPLLLAGLAFGPVAGAAMGVTLGLMSMVGQSGLEAWVEGSVRILTFCAAGGLAGWYGLSWQKSLDNQAHEYHCLAETYLQDQAQTREKKEHLEQQVRKYATLFGVTSQLWKIKEEQAIMEAALEGAAQLTHSEFAGLFSLGGEEGLVLKTFRGYSPWKDGEEIAPANGVLDWVAGNGQPVLTVKPGNDPRFRATPEETAFDSLVAVPLVFEGTVRGVITCGRVDEPALTQDDVLSFSNLAGQTGMALERVFLHRKLDLLAKTDGLTGLYNHRHFIGELEREFRRAQRYRTPLSLIILDLDHFKNFNDTFGHPAGDRLLETVGGLMRGLAREVDLPARYGGEEFAVILPSTDLQAAAALAERIRQGVKELEPQGVPSGTRVTASLGVAEWGGLDKDFHELVKRTDQALYEAKENGRDRVVISRLG